MEAACVWSQELFENSYLFHHEGLNLEYDGSGVAKLHSLTLFELELYSPCAVTGLHLLSKLTGLTCLSLKLRGGTLDSASMTRCSWPALTSVCLSPVRGCSHSCLPGPCSGVRWCEAGLHSVIELRPRNPYILHFLYQPLPACMYGCCPIKHTQLTCVLHLTAAARPQVSSFIGSGRSERPTLRENWRCVARTPHKKWRTFLPAETLFIKEHVPSRRKAGRKTQSMPRTVTEAHVHTEMCSDAANTCSGLKCVPVFPNRAGIHAAMLSSCRAASETGVTKAAVCFGHWATALLYCMPHAGHTGLCCESGLYRADGRGGRVEAGPCHDSG